MSMFAICCAIAPTAELKNHIVELSHNHEIGGHRISDNLDFLVFVDDVSRVYDQKDDPNANIDSTSASFAGKTAYECLLMLKDMLEENDANCFGDDMFAVLDERSLEDGTLLLVEENSGEVHSVRAVFELCEAQMLLWTAGKNTAYEAKERVKNTEDGVLRPGMDMGDC